MSRRKQSNPKPLKRKSEDVLEAVAELHHLPTDLFSLKDPEDEIQEYTIFTKVALREGFTLGPYSGHVLEEGQSQDPNHSPVNIMRIKNVKSINVRLCLTDDTCSWLKLLRLTSNSEGANISVALNGSEIWCRVKRNLDPNTELLVSHLVLDDDQKLHPSTCPSYTPVIPFKRKLNFSSKDDDFRFKKHRTRTRKERSDSDENNSENDDVSDCKSPRSVEADVCPPTLLNPGIKCEPRSPSSSPSSPPRDGTNTDVRIMKTPTDTSANNTTPYLNGYRYSAAFPYGTSDTPAADGLFKCLLCEITFSSPRTLQCHQLYYCRHRTPGVNSTSDTDPEETSQPIKSERLTNADKSDSPVSNCETSKQNTELPSSRKFTGSSSLYPCDENISKSGNLLATVNNFGSRAGTPRAPRTYRCPYCNYTSDKKASLSRHVRMHGGNSPSSENDPPVSTHPLARYCVNCDIQFASYKNYQVHKNFYCSTRHVHKSMASSAPSPSQPQSSQQAPVAKASTQRASPEKTNASQESNQYNMMLNQPLYAAISTSPLILVPCSYVAGGGLSPAAGLIPAGNIIIPNAQSMSSPDGDQSSHAANVIPTYTVMPGSNVSEDTGDGTPLSPQATERNAKVRRSSTEKVSVNSESKSPSPVLKGPPKDDVDKPLDLSCKKFTDNKLVTRKYSAKSPHESSNVLPISAVGSSTSSSSSSSCADDAVSPIMPLVPVVPGVSHAVDPNRNVPPQTSVPSGIVLDPRTSSLTPVPVLGGPQILVKQGTSKCKECNIVFYKHENYLVHKSLYCASRLQKTQSTSPNTEKIIVDDEMEEKNEHGIQETTNSKSPIITHPKTPDPGEQSVETSNHTLPNQGAVFQFYCMACGIKFTSIDNLTAHQTYYCPKRDIVSQPAGMLPALSRGEFRCTKCKNVYPTEESLRHHPCVVQRKCPYCDVYCPTLSATQRHLVTHTGVKSFRCSLCGYKGHTLRGMRTHIRIHLDKNNTTPEEAYILCVDEGGSEIGSVNRKTQNRTVPERNHGVQEALHNESMVVSLASTVTPGLAPSDIAPKKAVPDLVSDQVLSGDITHWCQICGYSSSYKGNVVRHVKLVHKDLMSSQSMASIVNSKPTIGSLEPKQDIIESANLSDSNAETNDSVKSAVNGTSVVADTKQKCKEEQSTIVMKSESVSPPPVSTTAARCSVKRSLSVESQSGSNSNASSSSKSGPKYCKACDISFNYLSNFLAHKKFYCTPRPGEQTSGAESGSVQSVQ